MEGETMPGIDLLSKIKKKDDKNIDYYYKKQYENWQTNKKYDKDPFFLLYKDFDVHLKEISSGALKLFLYYGFHAKNNTGESWPSIETISKYFDVSTRTVNIWNKELEDRGIISRAKTRAKSKTTYILPFSINFFFKKEEDIPNFLKEEVLTKDYIEVYGEISKVFHMFQWRKSSDNSYTTPYHELFIILKKSFPLGKYTHYTVIHFKIDNYDDIVIEEESFRDEILVFNSPYIIEGLDISIDGIAINSCYNIKKREFLDELISQLMDPSMDLSLFNKVNLIQK